MATNEKGSWAISKIDDGRHASAAFDGAGILHVVYIADGANMEMRHAWYDGANWLTETLVAQNSLFGELLPPELRASGEAPFLASDATGRLHLAFGLYASKGQSYTELLGYALRDGGEWVYGEFIAKPLTGTNNSLAIAPNGLVQIVTRKGLPRGRSAVVLVGLKGAKLTLTATPKERGTVQISQRKSCTAKCSEYFYPGTTVTLTAVPMEGKTFTGWRGACTGNNPVCTVTMDHSQSVTARFSK